MKNQTLKKIEKYLVYYVAQTIKSVFEIDKRCTLLATNNSLVKKEKLFYNNC